MFHLGGVDGLKKWKKIGRVLNFFQFQQLFFFFSFFFIADIMKITDN